jgi:hypothetical protein
VNAPPPDEHGRLFWVCLAAGWTVMTAGVGGAIANGESTDPPALALWLAGSLVAHDLVVAPAVFLVGMTLRRSVPAWARALVQGGLIVTGVLAVYSIPLLGGFGRDAGNPSILPRAYGTGLLVAVASVWAGVAILLALAWRARRRAD